MFQYEVYLNANWLNWIIGVWEWQFYRGQDIADEATDGFSHERLDVTAAEDIGVDSPTSPRKAILPLQNQYFV